MSSVRTDLEFWSIKLDGVVKKNVVGQIITQCQWAGFIMYGKKGNCVCKFALESMCFLKDGKWIHFAIYMLASIILGLTAAYSGFMLTK